MTSDTEHPAEARGRSETADQRADRRFTDILQELRVTLTGTQLTSGFLLAVAFQSGFKDLTHDLRVHYLVLVGLAALATVLGLTPVLVHRLNSGKQIKDRVVRVANRLLIATLVVVSLLVIGVTSFIFEVVVSAVAGLWAAAVSVVVLLVLWGIAAAAHRIDGESVH
ncbi:DUF6328 family protein [Microbacterium sp. NC79]|uniref:DUF6328 family protein n=1 Tax=Microbacterium sp. NC79 TaxID=2851009 RepID=UPI001C2C5256|nr:DUF6328 family protein [Microbacterium sp. NC79]MBV0893746.1 sodium:proton antiporter [Microbacterium sp. NC79]